MATSGVRDGATRGGLPVGARAHGCPGKHRVESRQHSTNRRWRDPAVASSSAARHHDGQRRGPCTLTVVVRAADEFRVFLDAAKIARSGMVDSDYYRAQTGLPLRTELMVARHYLTTGAEAGLSLHPLFEPEYLPAPENGHANPVLNYLSDVGQQDTSSPHPVFDLSAAERQLKKKGRAVTNGAWLAWVRSAEPGWKVPVPPGAAAVTWGELRTVLIEAARTWHSGTSAAVIDWRHEAAVPRASGMTSVILPVYGDLRSSLGRLGLLRKDVRELVFVGPASRAQATSLAAVGRVRAVRLVLDPSRSLATLWNLGAVAGRGERLIFVVPGVTPAAPAMDALGEALKRPGVVIAQPLNERPDMTISSAGAYFPPDDVVPSALLGSHPTGDVRGDESTRAIPAALSAVIAVRADGFLELQGFDPELGNDFLETDLSLRATAAGVGGIVLVPAARITVPDSERAEFPHDPGSSAARLRERHQSPGTPSDLLHRAGFTVESHQAAPLGGSGGAVRMAPALARPRSGVEALPNLRWTIDTPVTAGWWAEAWGDWHFANSLARALGRLGQHVAVDTKLARHRTTRRFDDVLLTLRGMDRVEAPAAPVNLMWVIYDPQDVTAAECCDYDQVFGASHAWAAARSAEWGMPIRPLLQCTDAEFFHPDRAVSGPSGKAVFVGNARRGGSRPIVEAALAAGVEVDIYGTGWDAVPSAAGRVVALRAPNADVGRLYAEAGVVLNDHLDGMRDAGFISNRLFDAVASGARVLSDPIDGAEELFGGSVQYCEPADVGKRLAADLDTSWPSGAERRATAAKVREEHSFDQRARVLLDAAIEVLRGGGSVRRASPETADRTP